MRLPSAACVSLISSELTVCPRIPLSHRVCTQLSQEEKQFFFGTVTEFIPRNGRHTIKYDDDDEEHLILASEIFEWVTQAAPKPSRKRRAESPKAEVPAAAAENGDAEEGIAEGRDGVPSTDPEWPRVNDLFWGRVKVRPTPSDCQGC